MEPVYVPKSCNISFDYLVRGIVTFSGRGTVSVSGASLSREVKIGLGVARFLASIPDNGITEEEARGMENYSHYSGGWLKKYLLKNGLVTIGEGGVYRRTEGLEGANYYLNIGTHIPDDY